MTERRAAGYVRVSQIGGRGGDSFLSPEMQREAIARWASYRTAEVVAWYTDLDRPAKESDHRPDFERLMVDAKSGAFDVLCVYRLTRFARSVSQAASRFRELRSYGVDLVSVTEDIDTSTASGSLMQNILFSLAEFESQRIGEEWRGVHAARRRRGLPHVTAPMLGYEVSGSSPGAIIPDEAAAVQTIFALALEGKGFGRISRALREQGFRPKRGGDKFGRSSIATILRNPLYAGLVRAGDELVQASHEPIISRATFEAVEAQLPTNAVLASFGGGLLSGLVTCEGCGYRMLHHGHSHGRRSYRCAAYVRTDDCPRPTTIVSWAAEEYVEHELLRRLGEHRPLMRGKGKRTHTSSGDRWTRELGRLRAKSDELTRALDTLADRRFIAGVVTDEEYRRLFERYATEREEVVARLADTERDMKTVRPLTGDLLAAWPTYSAEKRREVVRLACEAIAVRPAERLGGLPKDARARLEVVGRRLAISWRV